LKGNDDDDDDDDDDNDDGNDDGDVDESPLNRDTLNYIASL
jgi:hypothetical protein